MPKMLRIAGDTDVIQSGDGAKLELGCGRRKFDPESIGVDRVALGPHNGSSRRVRENDIVADIEVTPWEWAEDGSCDLIIAHQVLEHVQRLIPVMNEVYRIASDDAWVEIISPYYRSPAAFQDPTHCRFITEMTFRYWEPGFVDGFSDYGIEGNFAVAAEDWYEEGNIWQILRPIKTATDSANFVVAKMKGELFPAPPEIAARASYGFTGRPE